MKFGIAAPKTLCRCWAPMIGESIPSSDTRSRTRIGTYLQVNHVLTEQSLVVSEKKKWLTLFLADDDIQHFTHQI